MPSDGRDQGRIWLSSARPAESGADHEDVDERAALWCAKDDAQDQGKARARQVGHSCGARSRGRDCAATSGAGDEALSYRVAEATLGREVEREVLTGRRLTEH